MSRVPPIVRQALRPAATGGRGFRAATLVFGLAIRLAAQVVDETVTGNLSVGGTLDVAGDSVTLGTEGATYGLGLLYSPTLDDAVRFRVNREASLLWEHTILGTPTPAMRLDADHRLTLYGADGTTAGLTLRPASRQIDFGTATLAGDGSGRLQVAGDMISSGTIDAASLKVGGAGVFHAGNFSPSSYLPVTGGSSLTGGASGLTFNAGGTNQDLTFRPSGSGWLRIIPATEGSRTWLTFEPATNEGGRFRFTYARAWNPGSSRDNRVFTWGYNQGNDGGTAFVPGETALSWRLESFYSPSPGTEVYEMHLQYVNALNTVFRPISVQIDRRADIIDTDLRVNRFALIDMAGNQRLKYESGILQLSGTHFVNLNNITALQQKSADGASAVGLLKLNDQNRLILGPSIGTATEVTGSLSLPNTGAAFAVGTTPNSAHLILARAASSGGWKTVGKFEGGANADESGVVHSLAPTGLLTGARVYGGRWTSLDRGARLAGVSSGGIESAFLHLNAESRTARLSLNSADLWTASTTGLTVVPTTSSTSATTGALVVGGGMGIGGSANVGGTLKATNIQVGSFGVWHAGNFNPVDYLRVSGSTQLTGGTTGFTINAGGTNQNLTLAPTGTGTVRILGGMQANSGLSVLTNNTPLLQQMNAAGTGVVGLLQLNASNRLILGPSTGGGTELTGSLALPAAGATFAIGGAANASFPFLALGAASAGWQVVAKLEGGANSDGSGAVQFLTSRSGLLGAKLYAGRWSSTDRGARLTALNSGGAETGYLHLNAESRTARLNLNGTDVWSAASTGLAVTPNTASTTSSTGALVVTGGVGIGGRLNVAGAVSLPAAVTMGGAVTMAGPVTVTGNASVGGTLSAGGVSSTSFTTTSNAVVGGNLTVTGEVMAQGGTRLARKVAVPATSSDAGLGGDFAADENYIYVYVGDGVAHQWVRSPVVPW